MVRWIKYCLPVLISCTKDVGTPTYGGEYPQEVARILVSKCAVGGCHNNTSRQAAGGLSLITWESLFRGTRNGPAVIPYRPDYSTLCFYTNVFPELGPTLLPRMPIGAEALTREQYEVLVNWISNGAPAANGRVKFSDNPSRSKLYVTNQLCDLVMVLDVVTLLPMRCIDVGVLSRTEFPVCIQVSPDKKYWYVSFLGSGVLQKFDAATDTYIGSANLGSGVGSFAITSDSKHAVCVDNSYQGRLLYVDLHQLTVVSYSHAALVYPKSVVIGSNDDKVYIGAENGNYISVFDLNAGGFSFSKLVLLDGSTPVTTPAQDPTTLCLDAGRGYYYVGCQNSMEALIIDLEKDLVLARVPLPGAPSAIDLAAGRELLFVSCAGDSTSFPGKLGSVNVIDLRTLKLVKTIHTGYQPNGISVNNALAYVAVINSNISPRGPGPHHTSGCAGRNGSLACINLNTLELVDSVQYELAVYPYAIALRK